jgi:hypothetical protein
MAKRRYSNVPTPAMAPIVDATLPSTDDLALALDLPKELTERQRRILKWRLRGLTEAAIAQVENVSQSFISRELKTIRLAFAEQGKRVDQNVVVGESINLYQEVEHKAWELYSKASSKDETGDANKALATVMQAREKSLKLLMDLGLIKRAAIEHDHTVNVPPFVKKWEETSKEDKNIVVTQVIDAQFSELEAPQPPELPPDIQIFEDENDHNEN